MAEGTPKKSLWGGRFEGALDAQIDAFNRSFRFDRQIFFHDVSASAAWAVALAKVGALQPEEAQKLGAALEDLSREATTQSDFFGADDAFEDVHSFLETKLSEKTGDAARRLHAGRSRNDQVATALRLWLRDSIDATLGELATLQKAFVAFGEQHFGVVMPGYTHLQRAQPILLSHWALAYREMLVRDEARLREIRTRVNVMPLGSGALAGTSQGVDRAALAKALGFEGVTRNSLDAVSDRDFAVEFCAAASIAMSHLSRFSEDVILYASTEFGFFRLTDRISTGSSLMPQKKNPDPLELLRGKSGRVYGHLMGLLTTLKGLPLAYNKDLQEDKEPLFDTAATLREAFRVSTVVLANLEPQPERMREAASRGFLNATELADYLARKGLPFRDAHDVSGKAVLEAQKRGCELEALPLEVLQSLDKRIEKDIYAALSLEAALATKNAFGGTAPERVKQALRDAAK